jgi:hypothetical protein
VARWLVFGWSHKGVPTRGHVQAAAQRRDAADNAMASRAGRGRWVEWWGVSATATQVIRG